MANGNVTLDLTRDQAITLLENVPDGEVYNPLAEALDKATDSWEEKTLTVTINISAYEEGDENEEDDA